MDGVIQKDRRSLALQLRDRIRSMLKDKYYRAGDRLPSEENLVELFGVSRATIREALKLLEEEKIILVRHGLGRFLGVDLSNYLTEDITSLQSVTEMSGNLGIEIQTEVVDFSTETADELFQARLNLQPGEPICILQRARKTAGETIIFSIDIFPHSIVHGQEDMNSFQGSLLALMEKRWGRRVAYSRAVISAEQLTADLSLKIRDYTGASWIVMEQINYDENDFPILYSRDYHRGDKFRFHVLRRRR